MLNFLSFLVFLYVSGHFKQKKFNFFFTRLKISASIYLIFWRILQLFTTYWTDIKITCTSARLGSKPWALFAKSRLGACKAVYHPYDQFKDFWIKNLHNSFNFNTYTKINVTNIFKLEKGSPRGSHW